MASYWGVALSAMLMLAGSGMGAQGVWLALLIGASVSSACFALYYKRRAGTLQLR
jgi:Na+-driven multidrug efflux pump